MEELFLSALSLFHLAVSMRQGPKSILFTCRSLFCMWNHYYEHPVYYNYFYCVAAMILGEMFAETSCWSNDVLQYFMLGNAYTSYFPIFTIQLSPLIPKDLYCELFHTNMFSLITTDYMFAPLCYCSCWYLNQYRNENKYISWFIVFMTHSLMTQWVNTRQYVPEEFTWYPWYYVSAYFLFNSRWTGMITIK